MLQHSASRCETSAHAAFLCTLVALDTWATIMQFLHSALPWLDRLYYSAPSIGACSAASN